MYVYNELMFGAQVSDVYQLRRETFHVAVDFVDRYLSQTSDVAKRQLQLVGISALFVAAKVEVSALLDGLTVLSNDATCCDNFCVFLKEFLAGCSELLE